MTALTLSSLSRSLGLSPRGRTATGVSIPIVQAGLLAEWRFDDGAGQMLTDATGNGHHGQLGSTPGADVNDPTWQSYGLSFDGNDRVLLSNDLITGNHAISWFVVITAKAGASFQIVTLGGTEGSGTSYDIAFLNADIYANVYGGGLDRAAAPSLPFSAAGVYDPAGPSSKLYLNGALSVDTTPGVTLNMSGAFLLGSQSDGGIPLQGGLAFVTLHDSPLSAGEVAQMHGYAKALLAKRGIMLP